LSDHIKAYMQIPHKILVQVQSVTFLNICLKCESAFSVGDTDSYNWKCDPNKCKKYAVFGDLNLFLEIWFYKAADSNNRRTH
jgi:PHP family Zn ribbon phosphoesterase